MHYHVVTDEYWMKEKDAIVETLGYFQNTVCQPISQCEGYIRCMQRERSSLMDTLVHGMTFWEKHVTKRVEYAKVRKDWHETNNHIVRAEYELKKAYLHMYTMSMRMQKHWFDLVGVGYCGKEPRLSDKDFERLDKRWAKMINKVESNECLK